MKKATKDKIVELLTEHFESAKKNRSTFVVLKKQVEKRLNAYKKTLSLYHRTMEQAKKISSDKKGQHGILVSSVQELVRNTSRSIRQDRTLLRQINQDISKASFNVKKFNQLINEVTPYKKEA